MNSNNNNNKQTESKKDSKKTKTCKRCLNPFSLDIKDDIYDPFNDNDLFRFDKIKNRFFTDFNNIFTDFGFLPKEKEESKEEKPEEIKPIKPVEDIKMEEINTDTKEKEDNKMEEEKEEEINTDIKKEENNKIEEQKEDEINTDKKEKKEEPKNERICYSKIYCSTYNNINGEPHEENYTSQSIKQINNEHNISEIKETYKNSNGIYKSSYQRGLDDKITRYIKEKNMKTGKKNQKKIIKGIEENEINDFNKTYNNYSKQCGFKKYFKNFEPFGFNRKQLSNESNNLFFHKLLF